jgi:hypothetical protein
MPEVRFEPMLPVFERAKTAHAADGADRPALIMLYHLRD